MKRSQAILYLLTAIVIIWASPLMLSESDAQTPVPTATCQPGPLGVINPDMADGFRHYWPLYTQIAAQTGVDAALIAPLHYREHFGADNPSNNQGIFQLYSLVKSGQEHFPNSHGEAVTDEEFVRQGILAIQLLQGKVDGKLTPTPDEDTVRRAYWAYNGRSHRYDFQVREGQPRYDGSPYVMNEPGVRDLQLITRDGGGGPLKPDTRPGTWPIYRDLLAQCQPVAALPEALPPATNGPALEALLIPTTPSIPSLPKEALMGKNTWSPELTPLNFGSSRIFFIVAILCIGAAAFVMLRMREDSSEGNPPRFEAVPFMFLLILAAAGCILVADAINDNWSFGLVLKNIGRIFGAIPQWLLYHRRVTAFKTGFVGALIMLIVIMLGSIKSGGPEALAAVVKCFVPLIRIIRRIPRGLWVIKPILIPLLLWFLLVFIGQSAPQYFGGAYLLIPGTLVIATLYNKRRNPTAS